MAIETSVPVDFPTRLRAVRKLLSERCASVEAGREAAAMLERIERRLQRPPRIVVLGEANSGKSTLANALIGHDILKTDIVRNTRSPVLLRYADVPTVEVRGQDGSLRRLERGTRGIPAGEVIARIEVGLPLDILRSFQLVDTPGLTTDDDAVANARRLCRSAHMAIWCTVASQAWRATEVALWTAIGKRIGPTSLLAVTCAGSLGASDREKVSARVKREAGASFRAHVLVGDVAGGDTTGVEALRAGVQSAIADVQAERWRRASAVIRRFSDRLVDDARDRRVTSRTVSPNANSASELVG